MLVALIAGYFGLVAAGIVDFPWVKSKIENQLAESMIGLKAGLEELDQAIDIEDKGVENGLVYCRKSNPSNILHGFEIILSAKSYDVAGEPKFIEQAFAGYQKAIQTAKSENMRKTYDACLIFDRSGQGDPELTQEEFDSITQKAQTDITQALESINSAIESIP